MRLRTTTLLLAALLLAGCAGVPTDAPATNTDEDAPADAEAHAPGWPQPDAAALRPGDKLNAQDVDASPPSVRSCTANFVFASPDNRTLYVGTASHCVSGMTLGQAFRLNGAVDATLAYCSWGAIDGSETCTDKIGKDVVTLDRRDPNDFALFRVADHDRAKVHPALRHWGGPTGLGEPPARGTPVLTYGNSVARDAGQRAPDPQDPRQGYALGHDEWWTDVALLGPSLPGDSGSPVLLGDGRALGIVKTLDHGTNGVVNLDAALAWLHENTDLRVELRTWPLLAGTALPQVPPP